MREDGAMPVEPATFAVRVKPGASRARVGGRYDGARGPALVVSVNARAVEGAATEAVLSAVADALGVRRSAVRVVTGRTSRDKVLTVEGEPGLAERVAELRDGAAR
jgi:uncharacterized protein YggU (UPF0235/DUF167 family)